MSCGRAVQTEASQADIVFAFESVCNMLQTLKEDVGELSLKVDQMTPWYLCPSGWGWFDHTFLWFPWNSGDWPAAAWAAGSPADASFKLQVDTAAAQLQLASLPQAVSSASWALHALAAVATQDSATPEPVSSAV